MKIEEIRGDMPLKLFNAPIQFSNLNFAHSHMEDVYLVIPYVPGNAQELFADLGSYVADNSEYTPVEDSTKTRMFLWVKTDEASPSVAVQVEIQPHIHSAEEKAELLKYASDCDKHYKPSFFIVEDGKENPVDDSETATWNEIFINARLFYENKIEPEYAFFNSILGEKEIEGLSLAIKQYLN